MAPSSAELPPPDICFRNGFAFHQKGQLAEAAAEYQKALHQDPSHFDALHMLGVAGLQAGQAQQGVAMIEQAISLNPSDSTAYGHLGNGLQALGRYEEAMEKFDTAIELDPNNAMACYNRGFVLSELKRYEGAVESFTKALAVRPDYAMAYFERAKALRELGQLENSVADYDKAIALNADFAEAYSNRGIVLRMLHQTDAALASYDKAIELSPNTPDAHNNKGNMLFELLRLEEAALSYEHALQLTPENNDIRWNLSQCHLLQGNYESGWSLYEVRSKVAAGTPVRTYEQPGWRGETDISGKTLFVYWEQGFGDTIQFSRYVRLLKDRGIKTILQVERPLVSLMQSLSPFAQIIGDDEEPGPFDYHCPLMSLPLAFGTTLTTLANDRSYLTSTPDRIEKWSSRLGDKKQPRVGLVWSGSETHKNDQKRSIALSRLVPLFRDDFDFVSLQVFVRPADAETARNNPQLQLPGAEILDFSDTAALIDLMDVVISVDTAVAHLAGAMGKPVWLMLPFEPDWRWLVKRDDSPWYPSARLFRQPVSGDWDSVIEQLSQALDQRL